jgi:hypothetical protein
MREIEKFVCLLGLPRSGTTLATTILDAHPAVELFYEPWNSSKIIPPPVYENPLIFQNKMREKHTSNLMLLLKKIRKKFSPIPDSDASVVGFKETSLHQEALEWSKSTLASMDKHCECLLLIIVRENIHAYLSKVAGAKKYWNQPNAKVTEDGFKDFVLQSINSYRFMGELAKIYKTIVFDYDALVLSPEKVVASIMEFLGLTYANHQLHYYGKGFQARKIMGDPGFVAKSQMGIGISKESIINRQKESEEFKIHLKSDFWQKPEIQMLNTWIQKVHHEKIVSGMDAMLFS